MRPPFGLLVVHGDGSRIRRFWLPRPVVYATLGLAAGVATAGALRVQHQWDEAAALARRVDDQRALIASFDARVASVRNEIANWKVLHVKMWKAFGEDAGAEQKASGSDGVAGDAPLPAVDAADPAAQLALLQSSVAEEGPRLRELQRVVSRTGKVVRTLPLKWPVRGAIKSGFGVRPSPWSSTVREHHGGIDIGSPAGTPVRSPAPGTVVLATSGGDLGKHVMLDHGNGLQSVYGHMEELDVKAGDHVEKGQVIGLVGSTGRSTGPHLHYEVRTGGRSVDPSKFLSEQ